MSKVGYSDQLLCAARQIHVVYYDQLLGAVHHIHLYPIMILNFQHIRQVKTCNLIIVRSHYYDDKNSTDMKLTEKIDWEITVSKNNDQKPIING